MVIGFFFFFFLINLKHDHKVLAIRIKYGVGHLLSEYCHEYSCIEGRLIAQHWSSYSMLLAKFCKQILQREMGQKWLNIIF